VFKKILVPLDGTRMAEAVLPYVRDLAAATQATVELLYVSLPVLAHFANVDDVSALELERQIRADSTAYMHHTAQHLLQLGVHATVAVQDDDAAAHAIIARAEAIGADLIVLSTHGRSALLRMLEGSNSDAVIRGTHVPVLLIRPDLSDPRPDDFPA
jgi:nucleotide-binding universal stress UspA family protein